MNKSMNGISKVILLMTMASVPVMAQQVVAVPTQEVQVSPVQTTETVILRKQQPVYQEVPQQQIIVAQPQPQIQQQAPLYTQPKTVVEASPLEHSKASQMRDARHRAEISTEQKIVEKLEESRLEDERRRAERLFGNSFDGGPAPVPAPVVQQQPQVVVQPQPQIQAIEAVVIPQVSQQQVDVDGMKSDIYNSVKTDLEKEKAAALAAEGTSYFSGSIGTTDYSEAYNVSNNSSLGFSFGSKVDEYFTIEGTFNYSNFYVEESVWLYREMDQYNIGVAGKYSFLTGKVQPYVGGVASYTYRKYRDLDGWGYQYTSEEATSQSFDVGTNFGVDLMLSKKLAIGFDYKYMINITSRDDFSSPYKSFYTNNYGSQFIENMDYQIMSLSAKVRF